MTKSHPPRFRPSRAALLVLLALAPGPRADAETGHDLWLRYVPIEDVARRDSCRRAASALVIPQESPTFRIVAAELERGLAGMTGAAPRLVDIGRVSDGTVVVGTPATSPVVAALGWTERLARAGNEGYVIRSATVERARRDRHRVARRDRRALRRLSFPAPRPDRAADRRARHRGAARGWRGGS